MTAEDKGWDEMADIVDGSGQLVARTGGWKVTSIYSREASTTIERERTDRWDGLVAGSGKGLLTEEQMEALRTWLDV